MKRLKWEYIRGRPFAFENGEVVGCVLLRLDGTYDWWMYAQSNGQLQLRSDRTVGRQLHTVATVQQDVRRGARILLAGLAAERER